jgi:tRNA A-37 threonylcarbamoyl transferase component Bud32
LAENYLPDDWEQVSSSAFTRVAVNRKREIYFKEYRTPSPAATLKAQLSRSRATRARLNAEELLRTGIDAPHNVLWGQLPGGREYLFTVAAPGQGVDRWLRETLTGKDKEQLRTRRQLLAALGMFIGRVHATGFIHGDLKPQNILAAQLQDQFRFTLLNNDRNKRRKPMSGKMLLRDLLQLNMLPLADVGRTDRMRFFCAWRRQMRSLPSVETKILAKEAYRRGLRRLPKQPM